MKYITMRLTSHSRDEGCEIWGYRHGGESDGRMGIRAGVRDMVGKVVVEKIRGAPMQCHIVNAFRHASIVGV